MTSRVMVFLALVSLARAQSPPLPEFEVSSVKPNTSGGRLRFSVMTGGRLVAENASLSVLIRFAYNVMDFQIAGGPGWINSDPYDVTARAEGNSTVEQVRPMLQSLLADRFKLALHRETKELPVYELVAAKGGLRLAASTTASCVKADPKNPPPPPGPGEPPIRFCDNLNFGRGRIDALGVAMSRLTEALSDLLGRTVIDKTGATGTFDVHLEYRPDDDTSDSALPSIFNALQEQLGLRLDSAKGPVEVLVIDHVERPSAN